LFYYGYAQHQKTKGQKMGKVIKYSSGRTVENHEKIQKQTITRLDGCLVSLIRGLYFFYPSIMFLGRILAQVY
jgi:hypothetical protein